MSEKKTYNIMLRAPKWMKEKLKERSIQNGVSINTEVMCLISSAINSLMIEDIINKPYEKVFIREEDGSYFAQVNEWKGCMTVGNNLHDAEMMLRDAMKCWAISKLDRGELIPLPKMLLIDGDEG